MSKTVIQELITYVKLNDFKSDEGNQIKSAEVYTLGNYEAKEHDFGSSKGHKFAKIRLPFDVASKIDKLPALYNVTYNVDIDRDHKITLKPSDVEFVKDFKIFG